VCRDPAAGLGQVNVHPAAALRPSPPYRRLGARPRRLAAAPPGQPSLPEVSGAQRPRLAPQTHRGWGTNRPRRPCDAGEEAARPARRNREQPSAAI